MITARWLRIVTSQARLALAVAVAVGLAPAAVGRAAPPAIATDAEQPVAGGPPPWVVAGLRITYSSAVATIPAGSYELIEDPNGPLLDPVTGKRYRESYTSNPQAAAAGGNTGSGRGIDEITVVAVEGADVVLSRSYTFGDPISGARYIGLATSEQVAGDRVNGAWIRPDLLATMKTGELGNVMVLRGPVTVAGTSYEAVSLVDPTPGNYAFFAYDAATGIQLHAALRTGGLNGQPLQLWLTELLGTRQLAIPGFGSAVPRWLAARPELAYSGTRQFALIGDPMNNTQSDPMTSRTTFTESGATWATWSTTETASIPSLALPAQSSGATSGAGPYWWDPTALASMTAGQVLDTDPYTGMTIGVQELAQGSFGPAVVVVSAMPGLSIEARYDTATGVMTGQTVVSIDSAITTSTIELQAMPPLG